MLNVLLLTDFSESAGNAIIYAVHLFKSDDCKFYLMHVHKAGSFTTDDLIKSPHHSIYEAITKDPEKELQRLSTYLQDTYENAQHSYETLVDFDVFTDAVNQAVVNHSIDYIVMGRNGISGITEALFGSNTIQVIKKVSCKTLIIPEERSFHSLRHLLLPLEETDTFDGNFVGQVLAFNKHHQAQVHVLRIFKGSMSDELMLHDKSELSLLPGVYHPIKDVPLPYAIQSYSQTHLIDLVILCSQIDRFIERLLHDHSKSRVSKSVALPMLIIHN